MKMLEKLIQQTGDTSLAKAQALDVSMAYKWFNDAQGRASASEANDFPYLIPSRGEVWMEAALQTYEWRSQRSHIAGSGTYIQVGKLNGFSGDGSELTFLMEAVCKDWATFSKVIHLSASEESTPEPAEYFITYAVYSWVTRPVNAVLWLGTWGTFLDHMGRMHSNSPQQLWILDKLGERADSIVATLLGFFFSSSLMHLAQDNQIVIKNSRGSSDKIIKQRLKKGIPDIQFSNIDTSRFQRRVRREATNDETEIASALRICGNYFDQTYASSDNSPINFGVSQIFK